MKLVITCAQVWDQPLLGAWVHKMRKAHKEGKLPAWQVAKLEELVFAWKMDQQGAKWHHNLHEARRFKVRRPTMHIPGASYKDCGTAPCQRDDLCRVFSALSISKLQCTCPLYCSAHCDGLLS